METYETKDKALDVLYQIVERSQALFIPVVCVCVLERGGGFNVSSDSIWNALEFTNN